MIELSHHAFLVMMMEESCVSLQRYGRIQEEKGLAEMSAVYIDLSTISAEAALVLTDWIPFLHASFDS
jgi:hypothetical protein